MPPIKTIAKSTFANLKVCHRLLVVSAEILCRHSFGERYLLNLIAGFSFCCLCSLFLEVASPRSCPLFGLYVLAFFVLLCVHAVAIFRRPDGVVQSSSSGASRDFWNLFTRNRLIVRVLLEPAAVGLAGCSVGGIDPTLSGWLVLSAFCLAIKEITAAWTGRNQTLDLFDSRIEGERMNGIVRGRSTPDREDEAAATAVTQAGGQSENRPSLRQIFQRLDPALQRILSRPTAPPEIPLEHKRHYHAGPLGHLPRITFSPPATGRPPRAR